VVKSWLLKKYQDHSNKPLDLVNSVAAAKTGYPLALTFKNQAPSSDVNAALYAMKKSAGGLGVEFEFSNIKTIARKSLLWTKDGYLAQISTEVTENGVALPHQIAWRGGFGDLTVPNPAVAQHTVYYDGATSKLEVQEAKVAKEGPVTASGSFIFAGVEDTYFAAAFLPHGNGAIDVQTFSDTAATPFHKEEQPYAGAAVGGAGRNQFSLFVGPKDLDVLKKVHPKLELIVDWGWFGLIAQPLFLLVHWLNDAFVHNWGWSIIVATVLINFALLPLKLSSMKSMKKMQVLQPQIQAINERYKSIGMRDARKQQQNQEIMDLYSKHGANPMGGCVPMLLQFPLLIAFYKVFTIAIELRGASWLWVQDLSQAETFAIKILPIVYIASQFWMSKMTPPAAGADPAQQKMMQFMPLIFGVMFYSAASGLMLYWSTGNLVAIAQQWFFNKTATTADIGPPVKKKDGRK
jgi:YidC/Oxa1 family membrane protein insertase